MCLIAFAWQQHEHTLTLLGNRDEFHARPTRQAEFWIAEGQPGLLAGKDLEAGGTWLGVTRTGRFAALTNVRSPGARTGLCSRGALAFDYLSTDSQPGDYLARLADRAADYAGFNLLVGDRRQLWHFNSQEQIARSLAPGVYGLSNASLDSDWPKLRQLRGSLAASLQTDSATLLDLLGDSQIFTDEELPATGLSLEWERMLSATFIKGEDYGTRASTLLRIGQDGHIQFTERRFGPAGAMLGEDSWDFYAAKRVTVPD
ncbi:MAG TPA: NRDE family protein [Pseudomonas xinjiangensis]|uniref:NRDE family protein n=2 Tax=root TaxID=1 RepID=A0A7V1FRI9_9GAMM|nr:NRDE family protein [Halopseudomonas xinjiangensis]HEC48532.1 NRDE family protein [Halopseudomonas xinjiangensis]